MAATTEVVTAHKDLHSEQGRRAGEHPGRAKDPVVKVRGLSWLEFEKKDLARTATFARDFGLTVHAHTDDTLVLRGGRAGSPCMIVRKGKSSRFLGAAFEAADRRDLERLAAANDTRVTPLEQQGAGMAVSLLDPSGMSVKVVHGVEQLPDMPLQPVQTWNVGGGRARINATQRPAREPARIERLGHVVFASRVFGRNLDWYLQNFGLIVSDFLFLDGQRDRGPVMAFIRCDRGSTPSDHHTLAMMLAPEAGYVHSAFEVADLDALAAGGEYLAEQGYRRSWGVGRHIQGSQVFDYWRDPDRFMVEHYADGDLFDNTLEPGWAPMRASGLYQWGSPPTSDFLGNKPSPALIRNAVDALRGDNEIDLGRLTGLVKALQS